MIDPMHQELSDRVSIIDLLNSYCRALDRMDLDTIPLLFTETCVVSYGPHLESHGSRQLAVDLQRLWRWRRTSHHLSNLMVKVDGDIATAESYVIAWHEAPDGLTATLFGQYHDQLLRTPEGWRIDKRRQVMNGCDTGFKLAIHPLQRRPPPPGWAASDMTAAS